MGSAVFFLGAVFFFWDVSARWFRAKKTAHELGLRMVRDEHKVSDMEQRKAPKFIKIGELERRLMRAKQEAHEKMTAKQVSDLKSAAEKTAKAEAQHIAVQVAKIEAATAATAAKKTALISTFSKLRGSWAARAKKQLEEVDGMLEAVKTLQLAARRKVCCAHWSASCAQTARAKEMGGDGGSRWEQMGADGQMGSR